jgi:signal transduction histidine kinase
LRARLLIALLAMVLLPLALLGWLGARLVGSQERLVRQSFEELALSQLGDWREAIHAVVIDRERRLLGAPDLLGAAGAEQLRTFVRRNPLVTALLVLDPKGRLLHPPPFDPRTQQEDDFLLRAKPLLEDRSALVRPVGNPDLEGVNLGRDAKDAKDSKDTKDPVWRNDAVKAKAASPLGAEPIQQEAQQVKQQAAEPAPPQPAAQVEEAPGHDWYVWYHGSDLALLFWQLAPDGRVVGAEIDRARMLSDLIGRLPAGTGEEPGDRSLAAYALLDARGEVLYRWGPYRPRANEAAVARMALRAPLAAWQLVVYAPQSSLGGEGVRRTGWLTLGLGLLALASALGGLAWIFYREHTRGLRLAERRVSFVNQVSHELKTPLTNIRLYAELLAERLDPEDADAERYMGVVVSEGQRLGRLIENVLTFGRHQRGALRLRLSRTLADEVVRRAVDGFRPALAERGVAIDLSLGAPEDVLLDADALTQIVDNLLSNVEKYAAQGGQVRVATRLEGARLVLTVADQGPGIPAEDRERVFAPFERLQDALTEGAAGTGIGLAIVRELARLHGGDARVLPSERGAVFEVTLEGRLT